MSDNCFTHTAVEDLAVCPSDDLQAGLSEINIFYAVEEHVKTLAIPAIEPDGSFIEAGTISTAIEMETGKGFARIRALIDENELKDSLTGNSGNMKNSTEIEFFLSKIDAKSQGFKRKFKNVPLILIAIDRNGTKFLIGNKLNPSYMTQANGTTGKTGENNNGTAFIVKSNSPLLVYTGEIPLIVP